MEMSYEELKADRDVLLEELEYLVSLHTIATTSSAWGEHQYCERCIGDHIPTRASLENCVMRDTRRLLAQREKDLRKTST